jgi:hypothetical protein
MDGPLDLDALDTFLVERYWPGVDLATLRAALPRLEAAARAMTAEGRRIEHVGSILMPVDEVVFSLIAAGDESLVRQLNERADLPADRIAEAVALLADRRSEGEPGDDVARQERTSRARGTDEMTDPEEA